MASRAESSPRLMTVILPSPAASFRRRAASVAWGIVGVHHGRDALCGNHAFRRFVYGEL